MNINFKNSLLIIVDPFEKMDEEDLATHPNLEIDCYTFFKSKIMPLVSFFDNKIVSTWGNKKTYSELDSLKRVYEASEIEHLEKYENIFLCGFHYGRCILNSPAGALTLKGYNKNINLIENACMVFPGDSLNHIRTRCFENELAIIRGHKTLDIFNSHSFLNSGVSIKSFLDQNLEVFIHDVKFFEELKPEVWPSNLKKIVLDFRLESGFRFLENNSFQNVIRFFSELPEVDVVLQTSDLNISYVRNILRRDSVLRKINKIETFPLHHLERVSIKKTDCKNKYLSFKYKEVDKLFIYMNRSANISRNLLIEKILNSELANVSYISWLNIYNSESPIKERIFLDDINADKVQHYYPEEYEKALVDIFCETNAVYEDFNPPMITEKTWRPLLCGRIFFGFGFTGMYKYLGTLGFKKYDRLFDYTFDGEDKIEKRIDLFYESLISFRRLVEKKGIEETLESVKEVMVFNRTLAFNLIKKQSAKGF